MGDLSEHFDRREFTCRCGCGADQVDPQLALIKGGGGALLKEKIVAAASRRFATAGPSP